jgi:hypothetical protein
MDVLTIDVTSCPKKTGKNRAFSWINPHFSDPPLTNCTLSENHPGHDHGLKAPHLSTTHTHRSPYRCPCRWGWIVGTPEKSAYSVQYGQ